MKRIIFKYFVFLLFIVLASSPSTANTGCKHNLDLEGSISVKGCDNQKQTCVNGASAVYNYAENLKDESDEILTVAVSSSPWRLYGGDGRIIRIKDLAKEIEKSLEDPKVKSVKIYSSWSDVKPYGAKNSIAKQLSDELDGFPVSGIDGFLWYKSNGETYSTKQSFTIGANFPYFIASGDDVMDSLTDGAYIMAQNFFIKKKDPIGLNHAAVGWDVYMLCPDTALHTFELAAEMDYPIAAYNAAIMRLERAGDGDFERAKQLLMRAVKLGDKQSESLLEEISLK